MPLCRDGSSSDMHALALQKMHLGGTQRVGQRNAASWLAKKTRSIFSKSKSCTNFCGDGEAGGAAASAGR